jgi:hypothetical protein
VLYDCRAMASFEIDPEQSVSIVAILLFIDAAFVGFPLLQDLVLSPGVASGLTLFLFALVAGLIAGGVGLLKGERWGWYAAIASTGLLTLLHLAAFSLLALLFDGLILFLLTRPEVRGRFGVR